jgi:hypothetical protein
MVRPRPVSVVAWLLIVAGIVGIGAQAIPVSGRGAFRPEAGHVVLVCLVAIACGVFLLRGQKWARWLAVAWFAIHVVVGALHSWQSAVIHGVLLSICTYALFCRQAKAWFHAAERART